MKNGITIITGPIRSGKTTHLEKLISSLKEVGGITQISSGFKRFFHDVSSGEQVELTSQNFNKDTFKIGKFIFRKSAFIWAKEKLENSLLIGNKTIVIDEYGPLELNGEGFEPLFSEIIKKIKSNFDLQLIVVVRDKLLKEFLYKFELDESEVKIEIISNNLSQ